MAKSDIEWTDATWNPTVGCDKVSPGCKNCYAKTMHARLTAMGQKKYADPFETVKPWPMHLAEPLGWKKPQRFFVNSMSDLFHEDVSNEYIAAVFGVMAACPQHTFQVLTKRAERMAQWFGWAEQQDPTGDGINCAVTEAFGISELNDALTAGDDEDGEESGRFDWLIEDPPEWPLRNVWIGVSVEDQQRADERIPYLLRTPAAVRFLSCEPLLGPLDLSRWLLDPCNCMVPYQEGAGQHHPGCDTFKVPWGLDWIIVGGESGPGARPCNIAWIESIVAQCRAAGVAPFVKQLGAKVIARDGNTYSPGGKGGDWDHWAEDLRVREFPAVRHA